MSFEGDKQRIVSKLYAIIHIDVYIIKYASTKYIHQNREFPINISYIYYVDRVIGTVEPTSDNAAIVTHQTACGVTLCDVISAIGLIETLSDVCGFLFL